MKHGHFRIGAMSVSNVSMAFDQGMKIYYYSFRRIAKGLDLDSRSLFWFGIGCADGFLVMFSETVVHMMFKFIKKHVRGYNQWMWNGV
ncbi:hypothetical protein K1719_025406 [Acacia pycnantha]|nr:hypothetical protein K1719_025406 [Acacia pycnantha]